MAEAEAVLYDDDDIERVSSQAKQQLDALGQYCVIIVTLSTCRMSRYANVVLDRVSNVMRHMRIHTLCFTFMYSADIYFCVHLFLYTEQSFVRLLSDRERCVGACIHGASREPSEDETDGLRQQLTDEQVRLRRAHDDYNQRVIACAAGAMRQLEQQVEAMEASSRTAHQLRFAARTVERLRYRNPTWAHSAYQLNDSTALGAFQYVNNGLVSSGHDRSNLATARIELDIYHSIVRDVRAYAQKVLESLERVLKRFNAVVRRTLRRHFKPLVAALLCGVVCGGALYATGSGSVMAASSLAAVTAACSFAAGQSGFQDARDTD